MATISPKHATPSAPGKARRTRAAILRAAERRFAEDGFDRTRLEDVALDVGIRRASIVYHFKDKQALYEAVVSDLFDGLRRVIEAALASDRPPLERIEAAVSGWIDYVGERPALARVLLREVADGVAAERPALAHHLAPIATLAREFLEDWKRSDMPRLSHVEPAHVASTITGATVFFVAAMPRLLGATGFDPLSRSALDRYRAELLQITWQMLRIDGPGGSGRREREESERESK